PPRSNERAAEEGRWAVVAVGWSLGGGRWGVSALWADAPLCRGWSIPCRAGGRNLAVTRWGQTRPSGRPDRSVRVARGGRWTVNRSSYSGRWRSGTSGLSGYGSPTSWAP